MRRRRSRTILIGLGLVFIATVARSSPRAVLETQSLEAGEGVFRLRVSDLEPSAAAPVLRPTEGSLYQVVALPADPGASGTANTGWTYLGRYREPSPRRFTLLAAAGALPAAELRELAVLEPQAAPPEPRADLDEEWMRARLAHLQAELLAPDESDGFWRYQAEYLTHRLAGKNWKPDAPQQGRPRRPDGFLGSLELVTGMSAIEESLQLSVLQDLTDGISSEGSARHVNLSELKAPEIQSHDFEELSRGLPPGPIPETARFCPEDSLYLGFSSIGKLLHLADDAEVVRRAASRFSELLHAEGGTGSFASRLGLRITPELRPIYDLAVGAVAVVLDDPYLSEGPELSLIFETRIEAGFDMRIRMFDRENLAEHPGLETREEVYSGHAIRILQTADGSIRSFRASVGEYRIFSTSLSALHRVLDAWSGRIPALAASADFKYSRSVLPGGDGFVYISDACVRRFVSPAFKIGELRRVLCLGNLRVLDAATDLSDLEASPQRVATDLVREGYLARAPRCPHGGAYSYSDAAQRFRCSVHGTTDNLARLSEAPIETVSQREAQEYREFVDNYHQYWPRFFDPIAIQIDVGSTLRFSTCILPLIESTTYQWLKLGAGGAPRPLRWAEQSLDGLGALFTMKLTMFDSDWSGLSDDERRELEGWKSALRGFAFSELKWERSEDRLAWFGPEISVVLFDNPVDTLSRLNEGMGAVRLAVKDPDLAVYFFQGFAKLIPEHVGTIRTDGLAPGIRLRASGMGQSDRSEWSITSESLIGTWGGEGDPSALMDRLLQTAPFEPAAPGQSATVANAFFGVNFKQLPQILRTTLVQAETIHSGRCHRNLARLEDLSSFQAFAGNSLAETLRRTRSVSNLTCPDGGEYDRRGGEAGCSVHGTLSRPVTLDQPPDTAPIRELFHALDRISSSLTFTPEGIRTTLVLPSPTQRR